MTEATERRLAKAIFAGVLLELLVGATFQVLRSARADGNAISVGEIGFLAVFLLFSIVGVLIATRRPDNALGWLMLVIGFVAFEPASGYGEYALAAGLPGGASHVELRLGARDGSLEFEVRDDGTGFDPASTGYGTGLQGMADRLAALDGTLKVHSAPGAGATIIGRIPVAEVVD